MDNRTLGRALNYLNELSGLQHTVGVYAANHLPTRFNKPAAFILNTENSDVSVGHWVAIYIPRNGSPIYFDSFGLEPHVKNHISFLKRLHSRVRYNKKGFQSADTNVCGCYCLYYLAQQLGVLTGGGVASLSDNTETNDQLVAQFTQDVLKRTQTI
jgi:hypothetical protein